MTNNSKVKSNQPIAIANGILVLEDKLLEGKSLLIRDGKILAIVNGDDIGSEFQKVDAGGRLISPGLIDIHVHGALGYTFNIPRFEAFQGITQSHLVHGTTSLLATIATAPVNKIIECIQFTDKWISQSNYGSQVLGIHLEGPFFSMAQKGAQDAANIILPTNNVVDAILEHHKNIKIFSYAPELPGALRLTERLFNLDIIPAAGHSSAFDDDVIAAMNLGLSHIIHVWNAQSTTVREGVWRRPGLLESTLTFDGLTVEMIADNKHLPATLMKLAFKSLGSDRLCIVSDASAGAGLQNGDKYIMGDVEYEVKEGVGMTLDGTSFAGSVTYLNEMISVLTNIVGISLPEAIKMASLTPARIIGVDNQKGSIEVFKDADLVILNEDYNVWKTMIMGDWVFSSD